MLHEKGNRMTEPNEEQPGGQVEPERDSRQDDGADGTQTEPEGSENADVEREA